VGKISVVINVIKAEEDSLPYALASIKDFADEIVVVDMESGKEAVDAAKKVGAKVYHHKRLMYVEPARNYGISKTTGDWIFILDPDEELSKSLADKLKNIAKEDSADYVCLPRKNVVFGKWIKHSRWWPDYNIRFFKKGKVIWSEIIHSVPQTVGKGIDLTVEEENAIIHNHYVSIDQFVERMNRYTTEHAKNLVKKGYKFRWRDLLLKPSGEFFSRYFQGQGYKDGLHGLVLSGLQGFSEFVLYLKVWQSKGFKQKRLSLKKVIRTIKKVESNLHYWKADALLKEGGGFIQKIKRKFKLP
jgi:(heptosyl)LPS beta-1,4-glucosyltransferase